jgi:hypothetical protein
MNAMTSPIRPLTDAHREIAESAVDRAVEIEDDIAEAEKIIAGLGGSGTHNSCRPCEDWGTVVTAGVEHPCKHCHYTDWCSWRRANIPPRGAVVLLDGGQALVRVEAIATGSGTEPLIADEGGDEGGSVDRPGTRPLARSG